MGIPSPSIAAAQTARPIKLLPLPAGLIADLAGLGWPAATIPIGAYGLVAEPASTVVMGTTLGCHAGVPDDLVQAIVSAICDHPDRVRTIHPAAEQFDPTRAFQGGGAPLHPGAARYSESRG